MTSLQLYYRTRTQVYTVFLRSDAVATVYFTALFVRLLFEDGVYFFGKPRDINSLNFCNEFNPLTPTRMRRNRSRGYERS